MLYILRLQIPVFLVFLLSGCSYIGLENPFRSDPFTGGQNAASSILLDVRLPAGLQRYPSHGFINTLADGRREGLETFRGNISQALAAVDLFNALHAKGWELRLNLQKGDRSVSLYQKDGELAILAFHKQGMLTILEIWAGNRLPDGAMLGAPGQDMNEDAQIELPGEEYGPLEEHKDQPGTVEKWGSTLEEREL